MHNTTTLTKNETPDIQTTSSHYTELLQLIQCHRKSFIKL
jgi:hypothetical protein